MLGSLTPVQDIDPKEYSRLLSLNLLANQALIAAFDPLLQESRAGRRRRPHFFGRRRAARLLGRLWLVQGGAREPARRLCRRDRVSRPDQGPHRRPRRDAHAHARQCLSGRGAGQRQAAGSRRQGDRRAAARRTRRPARRCGSKPSGGAACNMPLPSPAGAQAHSQLRPA